MDHKPNKVIYCPKKYVSPSTLSLNTNNKLPEMIRNGNSSIIIESFGIFANDLHHVIQKQSLPTELSTPKKYSYGIIQMNDNLHQKTFSDIYNLIFYAYDGINVSVFIIDPYHDSYIYGYIISKHPTIDFYISQTCDDKSSKAIQNILEKSFPEYKNFVYIPRKTESFCKNLMKFTNNPRLAFSVGKIEIGLLYANHAQKSGEDMLKNRSSDVSVNYKHFLDKMNIFDFDEYILFDDLFHDIQYKWYPAVTMSKEKIRQHVGNVLCIVVFRELPNKETKYIALDTDFIKSLGKVNRIFIVIEKVDDLMVNDLFGVLQQKKNKYRVGVFYKDVNIFEPLVPNNHLFNENELREFILTKTYNGIMAIKSDSDISEKMHKFARGVELNSIINGQNKPRGSIEHTPHVRRLRVIHSLTKT